MSSSKDFVHLHTHSHYSLLEALPKIPDLIEAAKNDGQTALALTDNGNLYGAVEFYKKCIESDIKPIIGVDFFVSPRTRHDKEHRMDENYSRLILLAKDLDGYKNLLQLVSKSHLEGFFYRPRIDNELIEVHRDGLIAILPSYGGEHAYSLRHDDGARASRTLSWYRGVFGDDCYAEVTSHPEIEGHGALMEHIARASAEHRIPLVAAQDTYYLSREDALACDLVNKIRTGGVLNRAGEEYVQKDFSFRTRSQMRKLFAGMPEALEASAAIADTCRVKLSLGKAIFPGFPLPDGTNDNTELKTLAERGIHERGYTETSKVRERINYELGIIRQKGYASYFLIVADLLRHAREVGIFTNTRGSAAGSLVSYLCGITTVDPLLFNMPFERFLNPERPSAPDIDMDIADNRRDELIDYARQKYGETKVVQIGTFGTMMARAAVRDVARALGHSYATGDAIAKKIPFGKQGFPVTIGGALEEAPDLKELYTSDADAKEIIDLARKIEGNARHVGVHAAGVVIAPSAVVEYAPIQLDPKGGKLITQYDMYSIADEYGGVGLLKFDFLGLKNLSVLADSVERVQKRLGTDIDLERIPLDDYKTFGILSRGETLGVFQMAGSGMTSYLKDLRPTVIHDLNAMVALYRPGPMAFIPEYIERKRNPSRVKYLDPRMESILRPTYGILIYQDDVMMMAVQLAGYSWGEADKFRKAMGKKIPTEMEAQKEKFQKGCMEHGMHKDAAQKLWQQIETFAAYGFGKAHAASYGSLAYKTAYMKANFPVDYMAALLTSDAGDVEKIAEIVAECERMELKVLPPSVNESLGNFTVIDLPASPTRQAGDKTHSTGSGQAIRFGLYSIKNFGTGVADSIILARGDGKFADIADFLARVPDKNLNRKSLEALIKCGALDELGERGATLSQIETLLEFHRGHAAGPQDQSSLFGAVSAPRAKLLLKDAPPMPLDDKLIYEKELLGLYISGHPLDKYKEKLARQKTTLKTAAAEFPRGVETVIAGFLESVRPLLTKSGERMAFARISDYSGSIEVVVFPRVFGESNALFIPGTCLMAKGKFTNRNGESSFIIDKVKAL